MSVIPRCVTRLSGALQTLEDARSDTALQREGAEVRSGIGLDDGQRHRVALHLPGVARGVRIRRLPLKNGPAVSGGEGAGRVELPDGAQSERLGDGAGGAVELHGRPGVGDDESDVFPTPRAGEVGGRGKARAARGQQQGGDEESLGDA